MMRDKEEIELISNAIMEVIRAPILIMLRKTYNEGYDKGYEDGREQGREDEYGEPSPPPFA